MTDPRIGDLDRKAAASRAAAEWAERTQALRAGDADGATDPALANHFAQVTLVGGVRIATTSDGIGTKVELAERVGRYDTLGHDLVAMVVDDLAAAGATPLSLTNILDVDRIDPAVVDELMRGLHDAAVLARVSVTGGEIAELGARVGGFGDGMHANWCATAVGWYPPGDEPLTGSRIESGDVLVGLPSPGFRSNGLSLVRRVLSDAYGPDWHRTEALGASWGALALTPSRIYAPLVIDARRALGCALTGCAHITGGGLPNKLMRVLRATGLGADVTAPLRPPPEMVALEALGQLAAETVWRAWNMGHGMVLVVRPPAAAALLAFARERGVAAEVIGHVSPMPGLRIFDRSISEAPLVFGAT